MTPAERREAMKDLRAEEDAKKSRKRRKAKEDAELKRAAARSNALGSDAAVCETTLFLNPENQNLIPDVM